MYQSIITCTNDGDEREKQTKRQIANKEALRRVNAIRKSIYKFIHWRTTVLKINMILDC